MVLDVGAKVVKLVVADCVTADIAYEEMQVHSLLARSDSACRSNLLQLSLSTEWAIAHGTILSIFLML
jgi:hypothetical protein